MLYNSGSDVLYALSDTATDTNHPTSWCSWLQLATTGTTIQDLGSLGTPIGNSAVAITPIVEGQRHRLVSLTLSNNDVVTHTFTVYFGNPIPRVLFRAELLAGWTVQWLPSTGWQIYTDKGIRAESAP